MRSFACRIFCTLTLAFVGSEAQMKTGNLRGGTVKESKFFLWLSDFHYDPYYGTHDQQCSDNASKTSMNKFGTFGCDAPHALVKSALAAAAGLDAEFVLFTGDFTRHDQNLLVNPSGNVSDIIRDVSQMFAETLPNVITSDGFVMGALGNDDSPQDYELNITTDNATNSWLDRVGGVLVGESVMRPQVHSSYDYGGFFNVTVGGIEILSLDTVIYSVHHTPTSSPLPNDPFGQMTWLRQRLETATEEGRTVWIVGHIPPGIETYGYTELWHKQYLDAYLNLVEDSKLGGCIAAQLFGHVHKEEIRTLSKAPPEAGPVLLMGSLSPIYKNNPSFRLVEYDASTGRMLDYSDYYAQLPEGEAELEWTLGYKASQYKPFQAAKKSGGITSQSAKELAAALVLGGEDFSMYSTWYATNHTSDLTHCAADPSLTSEVKANCIKKYVCALSITMSDEYQNCIASFSLTNMTQPRPEDFTHDLKGFHEAARRQHWRSIGLMNLSFEGGGFA